MTLSQTTYSEPILGWTVDGVSRRISYPTAELVATVAACAVTGDQAHSCRAVYRTVRAL